MSLNLHSSLHNFLLFIYLFIFMPVLLAPVHQMQQYYRLGTLDNCSDKWNALVDCLTLKTKRSTEVQVCLFVFSYFINNGFCFFKSVSVTLVGNVWIKNWLGNFS